MFRREICVVINVIFFVLFLDKSVECFSSKIEKISQRLDKLLENVNTNDYSFEDPEKNIELWQHYEFGTGIGNRDELSISNIAINVDPKLSNSTNNYEFIERDGEFFLANSIDHVFHLYKLDLVRGLTTRRIDVDSAKKIINFKLIAVPNSLKDKPEVGPTIIAILCVESEHGSDLFWYRLIGNDLVYLDTWSVQNRVESLQYFHHDGENRLLILREASTHFDQLYSPIDIYGFSIDGESPNLWLTQRLSVSKTFDIHVCPNYDSTIIALRRRDDVVIYDYKDDHNEVGLFTESQNVTSNNLKNLICFESGYIRYLVTSGPEAALFDFFEGEFHHDSYSEHIFNEIGEISWIRSIPIDNYRQESLLLVQLKNSTIIALSWKGQGFAKIPIPDLGIVDLDLSRVTVIPKYGFVYGNKLVNIVTRLDEKPRPVRDEMEKLLHTKNALAQVLRKQEFILDETEIRINKSILVNPVISGFWNLSALTIDSVIIEDGVSYDELSLEGKKMTLENFMTTKNETSEIMSDLEMMLEEVQSNLGNSVSIDSPEVNLIGNLFIDGNFDVRGTMFANNLTFDYFNDLSRDEIIEDFYNHNDKIVIEGKKTFESIKAEKLNILYVNGVPIERIKFDSVENDWSSIDFEKLTKLRVKGNLNFTRINGVDWQELMAKVIFKSKSATIPGVTIVEGDLETDNINIEKLNGVRYPEDYVLAKNRDPAILTGNKKFEKLTVDSIDLDTIKTINGKSIDEYVTLNGNKILEEEITFDDLTITESLQIDGEVLGLTEAQKISGLTLYETSDITADVVFRNLKVIGNIEVENSIDGKKWSDLDDLLGKDDEIVEITGHKTFLNDVQVDSNLVIEKKMINDLSIDEFVTLDTDQEFPNLKQISGNVTFGNVTRGDLENLNKLLHTDLDENNEPKCLSKVIVFKVPPIVDHLFIDRVNGNITAYEFSDALNRTFSNVHFQSVEVSNLHAREIIPITVNNKNFEELKNTRISKRKSQILTGNYEIDSLETEQLTVDRIQGMTTFDLENLKIVIDDLYDRISNGIVRIEELTVNGSVDVNSVNGKLLKDIYDPDTMGTIVFDKDIYIENLMVHGLVNGLNFTEFAEDAVQKNDTNVIITGEKIFDKINCDFLEASSLNGKSVETILDTGKNQIITGSMRINGTVTISDRFETERKIGNIPWPLLRERSRYLGNDTYSLNGDVIFIDEKITIQDLFVNGTIQGIDFQDLLESMVYKNSKNLTIEKPIIFKCPVTIDAPFTITKSLNNMNLEKFYNQAVRIDRPFSVKSRITFKENIVIAKDLLVEEKIDAKTIGGVDLKNLYENAAFIDRPKSFLEPVVVNEVIFETDIEVETLNNIDLSTVITLNSDQIFDENLRCLDISVGRIDIDGKVNGHDLGAIYDRTFMLTGNQNISSHIVFTGSVKINNNFDAASINGVDPRKMISLDGNETLRGNFVFKQPIVVSGNVWANNGINGIDLKVWQEKAITTSFPIRQIVDGAWTIYGNVHFEKNVYGNDFLDGVNVKKLANDLHERDVNMESAMANLKRDLQSICEDIGELKKIAENQIYKYEYLDYLQVLNFDRSIISIHQFESHDFDYLLVNFHDCHLDIFVFDGSEFKVVLSLSNVGKIEKWLTMNYDGEIYFITVGKYGCEKNSGNLWKLDEDQFIHVSDLGNVTDAKKIKEDEFLMIVDGFMIHRSIVEIYQKSLNIPRSYEIGYVNFKFLDDSSEILVLNRSTIYEYKFENGNQRKVMENCFGTIHVASFRVGIYEREIFVYYGGTISEGHLFITDGNFENQKILQTIEAQRPSSIILINFDGMIENFLIFIENGRTLRIYEYRGIEGFVYRESITMKAEKIFNFKLGKYSKLTKKHCLAAIMDKRLIIMEAKMHGEKLDMGTLNCDNNLKNRYLYNIFFIEKRTFCLFKKLFLF